MGGRGGGYIRKKTFRGDAQRRLKGLTKRRRTKKKY